jgi:hypothetical protein
MEQLLRDTAGMGALLRRAGSLAPMAGHIPLPGYAVRGRAVALSLPAALRVTGRYFAGRVRSLRYYAGAGPAGSLIAIVPHYPFIVLRSGANQYYPPDVFRSYAVMFLIPAGTGISRYRNGGGALSGEPVYPGVLPGEVR